MNNPVFVNVRLQIEPRNATRFDIFFRTKNTFSRSHSVVTISISLPSNWRDPKSETCNHSCDRDGIATIWHFNRRTSFTLSSSTRKPICHQPL